LPDHLSFFYQRTVAPQWQSQRCAVTAPRLDGARRLDIV